MAIVNCRVCTPQLPTSFGNAPFSPKLPPHIPLNKKQNYPTCGHSSGTCGILVLFLIRDCQRSALGHTHVHASRLTSPSDPVPKQTIPDSRTISQPKSHLTWCSNKQVGAGFVSPHECSSPKSSLRILAPETCSRKQLSQLIVGCMVWNLFLDDNCWGSSCLPDCPSAQPFIKVEVWRGKS